MDTQQALGANGIAAVAGANEAWIEAASEQLEAFLAQHPASDFLGEDIRVFAEANGLEEPTDKRAWGAVIQRAARAGLIIRTEEYRKVTLTGNASRWGPVWIAGGTTQ